MIVPNEQQHAAAHALSGRVLISAGAGSGKTRTLVDRFVNALEASAEEGWQPLGVEEILAITFTEKAASEIAERVRSSLRAAGRIEEARQCDNAWIGTIHGFCSRTLRRYALKAQIDPLYRLQEGAAGELLRERAFEQACRADASGAALRLLEEYGYPQVYVAVRALAEQFRTSPDACRILSEQAAGTVDGLIDEATELMASTRDEVRGCGATGVRAAQLLDACCETIGTLDALKRAGLDSAQQAFAVWEALDRFRPHSGAAAIKEAANAAKEAKLELMSRAATAILEPHCAGLASLAQQFDAAYSAMKQESSALDFEDLQTIVARLLREDPAVLAAVRRRFGLVMVDEFQDTNALQLELVSAVAGHNLCSVGDAQQSIYRFRGARVEVYRAHREAMRDAGAREFELAVNYRSHGAILAFVNHVFEPLFGESFLALRAGREGGDRLPATEARVETLIVKESTKVGWTGRPVEADAIATRFAELRDAHGFAPDEMVVLLGAYTHAQVYADALASRGFTVSVVGGSRFFRAPEIAVIRALLSVIVNPADETPLSVTLGSDAVGVSATTLWEVGSRRREAHSTLWEAVNWAADNIDGADGERLSALVDAVRCARESVGAVTLPELIMRAIERLDYDLVLAAQGVRGSDALANIGKLLTLAAELESSGESGPAALVAALDARERYGEHTTPATDIAPESGVVQIMSIHSSKGLEYPVVAVPELGGSGRGDSSIALWDADGDEIRVSMRLPSTMTDAKSGSAAHSTGYARLKQLNDEAERAEKTRLFYVACTRAREVLLLSGSGAFSSTSKSSDSAPVDWLRRSLSDGMEFDGKRRVVQLADGAHCAVTLVDAGLWHEDRVHQADTKPGVLPPDDADPSMTPHITVLDGALAASASPHEPLGRLSYTDFSTFDSCPKRYWLTRVLRMGAMPLGGTEDPMALGTAVHVALELSLANGEVDEARLANLARIHGLSPLQSQELDSAVHRFTSTQTAWSLRQHERLSAEWPFFIPLESVAGRFAVVGSVDAYGRSGDSALIVDYKTGRSGDPDELSKRYELQASIYAFAALADGCADVEVVFIRPQVVDERGQAQQIRFSFHGADRERIETELTARHVTLVESGYPRREKWDHHICGTCPAYGTVCDIRKWGSADGAS